MFPFHLSNVQFTIHFLLQDMRRERRGERLSLADLLAKPHQRIPRYRLLIQRLLEHTPTDHTDFPLLKRAEQEIHELALKISAIQKETNDQESRMKVGDGLNDICVFRDCSTKFHEMEQCLERASV